MNPPTGRPQGIVGRVRGPHVHLWADNRQLCTPSAPPARLRFARPLPGNIRNFENAFRWFCGACMIRLDGFRVPEPPVADRLL